MAEAADGHDHEFKAPPIVIDFRLCCVHCGAARDLRPGENPDRMTREELDRMLTEGVISPALHEIWKEVMQ